MSTNCLPKWACGNLQGGLTSRLRNCPSLTEWAYGASPYLFVISREFCLWACPCKQGQATPTGRRIFQADRIDGLFVQTRLPEGDITVNWDVLYFCLLVAFLLAVFFFRKWCGSKRRGHAKVTKANLREEPNQIHMADEVENFIWVILNTS